jgi:predicted amidohydrolase YtcJ
MAGEGRLSPQLVDVHAHVLLAALTEVALLIAQADDVEHATARAEAVVAQLLDGLFGAAQR